MDISIVELESMPRDEFRALNMPEVARRFALMNEPAPIAITSEIVGDYVRVKFVQPRTRIIDYLLCLRRP